MFGVTPDGTAFDIQMKDKPVAFFEYEQDAQIYSAQKYQNHAKIKKYHVKETLEQNFIKEAK
jgi:hypothetical protein